MIGITEVATCRVGANAAMVQQGYAWAYRKYLQDPIFLTWEAAARNQRLGLWNDPNAVPPWEWRKHGAAATVPLGTPSAVAPSNRPVGAGNVASSVPVSSGPRPASVT